MQVVQVDERDSDWADHSPLVGMDVMDATEYADEETLGVRARMLRRRQAPVGVPEADRAPADFASPYTDGTESRT